MPNTSEWSPSFLRGTAVTQTHNHLDSASEAFLGQPETGYKSWLPVAGRFGQDTVIQERQLLKRRQIKLHFFFFLQRKREVPGPRARRKALVSEAFLLQDCEASESRPSSEQPLTGPVGTTLGKEGLRMVALVS